MTSTPNTMEDALRETLLAMRVEAGWGCEVMAAQLRDVRSRDGRPATIVHTTVLGYESHAVPRSGWDLELLPDYAEIFGTTVEAIWAEAAIRYFGGVTDDLDGWGDTRLWGRERLRSALRRALEG